MFPNGKNIVITGGTFVEVAQGQDSEFKTLYRHISVGALLDSGERFNPPRCHPETRRTLLSTILAWITKADRNSLILWLKGSAGSGKSALAQSIAERCRDLGIPAASFFFSRLYPERCHERFLCPTICYQIALSNPETRIHVEDLIRLDPAIFGLAFRTQFQKLIVAPLNLTQKGNQGDEIRTPQLIILDGLDECQDPKAQGYILDVITQEITGCEHVPLLFVITSRPEDHICIKFASGMLHRITFQLSLEDYYGDHDDIRIFINSGFQEIKQNHPLRHYLPSAWPSLDVIEELVKKSSGQFVYAAMVVEYVSSNQHRPTERLDIILGLSPHDGDSPFTELDALFKHVFSLVVQRKHALRILSAVILMDLEMSHEVLEKLLSLKPGDVRLYLGGLASLIDFHDHRKKITVLHSSLRDFLLDPNRSGDFCIDDKVAHADIAIACLRQLEILDEPILVDYACYNIETHLDSASGTPQLRQALSNFDLGRFHHSARNLLLQRYVTDVEITLEVIWYFIPTFFDCIRNTVIFDDWEDIYDRHIEVFDEYIAQELDKYTGDSRLRDLVTMLTISYSPTTVKNLDNVPRFKDAILQLDSPTAEHLVLIDEGSLNIRNMVRRHGQSEPYIELLCQYLEDPSRSSRHFIDGEKYALSARRCSEQIAKPFPRSNDERDAQTFVWSLESTPHLLLYATYHEGLVSFLEHTRLGVMPPQNQYSLYPTLARLVQESRIAYLISSSFLDRGSNIDTCAGHASQFHVVPQGLKIMITPQNLSTRSHPKFDGLLSLPLSATTSFCCCSGLLVDYFLHPRVTESRHPFNPLRLHDQSSIIVQVENPCPEIDEQSNSIVEVTKTPDIAPTLSGVMKILTYKIWRNLVQKSGERTIEQAQQGKNLNAIQ